MDDDTPIEAELARLADGSLPDPRARELRARISESPDLRERLREQEQAVALTRASGEILAPASLHATVREQVAARGARRRRTRARRPAAVASFAAALAAVVLLVVLLPGASRSPTVAQTARVALAAPTRDAPGIDPANRDLLSLRVGSIAFPAYESRSDWRAVGARTDEIGARRVQTVFYDIAGARVGYSIVPGAALGVPSGRRHAIDGVVYTTRATPTGELVTWRRRGHTCVIAARRVGTRTLLRLADATHIAA